MSVPIHVDSKDKIPNQEHYAIFKFRSQSTSTYEANDGSVTVINYEAYLDRASWLAEIEHLEKKQKRYGDDAYVPLIIKPAKVTISVNVNVE